MKYNPPFIHKRIIFLLVLSFYSNVSVSSKKDSISNEDQRLLRQGNNASESIRNKHIGEEHDAILDLLKSGEISEVKINTLHNNQSTNERTLKTFQGIKNYQTQPIRITFDTRYLQSYEKQKISIITDYILPRVKHIWKSTLKVIPIQKYTIPFDKVCKDTVIVPEDYKVRGVRDGDLLIFVDAIEDCRGYGGGNTLAFTSICVLDPFTDRPIIGRMTYCLDEIDLNPKLSSMATTTTTMNKDILNKYIKITLHEVGHILGMQVQLFPWFRTPNGTPRTPRPHQKQKVLCTDRSVQYIIQPSKQTIQPIITNNILRYVVVLPTVKTVVQNQFNCEDVKGAYLENQDEASFCFGNHWDERYFFSEIMGPYYTDIIQNNILSALTLSLFEDSGWYTVNYNSPFIKNSPFGYGSGCDFLTKNCIHKQSGEVLSGEFCNEQIYFDASGEFITKSSDGVRKGLMCDPTHSQKAYCNLVDQRFTPYTIQIPPWQYRYFVENKFLGPLTILPDYCPIPMYQTTPMQCNDEDMQPTVYGEEFTSHSRCIHIHKSSLSSSACFRTKCNSELGLVQIFIKGVVYDCEYDGQVFNFDDDFYFECPRFASICPDLICPSNCSGKGKCIWSAKMPYCECFDENDVSDGCYGETIDKKKDVVVSEKPSLAPSSISNFNISSSVDFFNHTNF